MTVSATSRKTVFNGSGSTGPFTFNFRILDSSHIIVTHIDTDNVETTLTVVDDYTIALVDLGQSGGSITLDTALAVGERLVVEGATPISQATGFSNQGRFFPESHEAALDKLTLIAQELDSKFTRGLRIPTADTSGLTVTLPVAADRASKFLAFDASGNVTVTSFSVNSTGQLPWFTPTTSAPTLSEVSLGMYKVSSGVLGFASNSTKAVEIENPASAVNYLKMQGAITANSVSISALGSDAKVGIDVKSKGTTTDGYQFNGLIADVEDVGDSGRHRFLVEGAPALVVTDTYWNPNASYSAQPTGYVVISSGADTNPGDGSDMIAGFISVESPDYDHDAMSGKSGLSLMIGAKGPTGSIHFCNNGAVGHVSIGSPTNPTDDDVYITNVNQLWLRGGDQSISEMPVIFTNGQTNVSLTFYNGSGTGAFTFLGHNTAVSILQLKPGSTSAIQGFTMTAAATGSAPVIGVGAFNGYTSPDTNVGISLASRGLGAINFYSHDAAALQVSISAIASAVNYLALAGSVTGSGVPITVAGSDTNISMYLGTKGTGGFNFYTNSSVLQVQFAHTATAVNYLIMSGNVTGNPPTIYLGGSDTNIALRFSTKGTGSTLFYSGTLSRIKLQLLDATSSVNYLTITPAATGSGPIIGAAGSDTDVDIKLTPKGAGLVSFGTRTAIGAETVTGYITIKDSGGTSRKIAVVS